MGSITAIRLFEVSSRICRPRRKPIPACNHEMKIKEEGT
uniref:Uncharacterized protein n=1 Tax=Arundo donax TaxID=35708 RepID=A0A0A9CTV3_ARUDO